MLKSAELETIRATLLQRLADLDALAETNAEDLKPIQLDQTAVGRLSRMDSLQVQAMAEAAKSMRALEKRKIAAALKRIDTEEYGYCAKCGDEIARARLNTDPTIALCIGCAG